MNRIFSSGLRISLNISLRRACHLTGQLISVAMILVTTALPQDRHNSPVFKDYVSPESPRIVRRSNATYKLWELFLLNRGANGGDPLAQHELGLRYLTGEGLVPDTVKAAYWIQLSAEQLVIPAKFNLGILSYYGWGVAWDPFKAFNLFLYAANQNMREAQYILGQFYADNLVVPQNYDEARRWLTKASESGYEPATKMLERLDQKTTEDAVKEQGVDSSAITLADSSLGPLFLDFEEDSISHDAEAPWLQEVLEGSGAQLRYAFGGAYETESGVKADSIGLQTIRLSAGAGSPEALVLLGKMYDRGIQVEADIIRSALCYLAGMRLGSVQGYEHLREILSRPYFTGRLKADAGASRPDAMILWAGLYATGLDLLLDNQQERVTDSQAFRFLERAAGGGSSQALVELGLCYFSGRWVSADQEKALSYWKEASDAGNMEGEIRGAMITVRTEGDPVKLDEAIGVLTHASSLGSILAEVGLAYCYETGTRLQHSKGAAAGIYRRAAFRGSQDAYYSLKRMHDELRPEGQEFDISNE